MTTLLAFLFVISVLVFVHELGHFLVARWFGVRVLTFSLGFGPKLLSFRRGATEYCLSAIPLGGYLKMAGEHMTEARATHPDEFIGKPRWQRCLILLAGPAMNVGLTVAICTGMLLHGVEMPVHRARAPIVGTVLGQSPAERAGLKAGDLVLQIGDRSVSTWTQLDQVLQARSNQDVSISVLRAERIVMLEVTPAPGKPIAARSIGILPEARSTATVSPAGAGDQAGVKESDIIVAERGSDLLAQPARCRFRPSAQRGDWGRHGDAGDEVPIESA